MIRSGFFPITLFAVLVQTLLLQFPENVPAENPPGLNNTTKTSGVLQPANLSSFPASHTETAETSEENEDGINFGGAVRFNVVSQHFESDYTPVNTYATWDTWRLNIDGELNNISLNFEYRFYPSFATHFIHHGYIGYDWTPDFNMQLGVVRVPFGNLPYNSHTWWFQTPYYVGLEDDHNMGGRFNWNATEDLDLQFAYFRQAEPSGTSRGDAPFASPGTGSYNYNIIPNEDEDASIRMMNQFNLRGVYELLPGTHLGASLQTSGIYNSVLDEFDRSAALAGHINANFGSWNFLGQYTYYHYNATSDFGDELDLIHVGAYGDIYQIAAEASMYSGGLAYSIDTDLGPIHNIQPYLNYTYVAKAEEAFHNSQQLVPGFLVSAGGVYTYVDFAFGQNHPWLTEDFGTGLDEGVEDADWNLRFNINIGYYF